MAKRVFKNDEPVEHMSEGAMMMKSELPPAHDKKLFSAGIVVAIVCFVAACVFLYLAFAEKKEDQDIADMWDNVRVIAGAPEDEPADEKKHVTAVIETKENDTKAANPPEYTLSEAYSKDPLTRTIDWDALLGINQDVLCWVYAPGTQINYPVMQEQKYNEAYYLNHNIYKKSQKSGSIFVPAQLDKDVKDMHLLLYGHHMKSGSMFGSLTKFKDKSFYESHPYIYLYYPDHTEQWEIWTAKQVKSSDKVYMIPYQSGSVEYDDLLRSLEKNSVYKTDLFGVDANTETMILSTCDHSANGSAGRFVVGAIMVDSVEPGNGYIPVDAGEKKAATDSEFKKQLQESVSISDDYDGYEVGEGEEYEVITKEEDEIVSVSPDKSDEPLNDQDENGMVYSKPIEDQEQIKNMLPDGIMVQGDQEIQEGD